MPPRRRGNMQKTGIVVVVLLALAGLCVAAFWPGDDVAPAAPGGQPRAAAAGVAEPAVAVAGARADVARDPGTADPDRVAAAGGTAPPAGTGGAGSATVCGVLVDEQDRPVAEASVAWWPAFEYDPFADIDPAQLEARQRRAQQGERETHTDAEGRFVLQVDPQDARLRLLAEARGHRALTKHVTRGTAPQTDLGRLRLQRGAILGGRVVDRRGKPVEGAQVSVTSDGGMGMDWFSDTMPQDPRARRGKNVTDDDGRFELAHVEPGTFAVVARHRLHPSGRVDDVKAVAGAVILDLTIPVDDGAELRGRVVRLPEGAKDLTAMASRIRPESERAFPGDGRWGERTTRVEADGTFVIPGLMVGHRYRVWAGQPSERRGIVPCTPQLEVAAGTAGVELWFEGGASVAFTVVDARDGAPIEQLFVDEQLADGARSPGGWNPRAQTAQRYENGRVVLEKLRPGPRQTLSLAVEATGFARWERKGVVVPATGTLDLGVVRLAAAPSLTVVVTSSDGGRPLAGARVRLQTAKVSEQPAMFFPGGGPDAGGSRSATTDAHGRATVNLPGDGEIVLGVEHEDHAPHRSPPFAADTVRGEHAVTMLRGGAVELTALGADSQPLLEVQVEHATPDGRPQRTRTTDRRGQLRFERLVPGDHRFRLPRAGEPNRMFVTGGEPIQTKDWSGWTAVAVADGATVAIELRKAAGATLRGVVRENGEPVAGARVTFVEGLPRDRPPTREEQLREVMTRGGLSATTAADGSFELVDLLAGAHRVRIAAPHRAMASTRDVQLVVGENATVVDLDVTSVQGVVRDPAGAPVSGARLSILPEPSAGGGRELQDAIRAAEMLRGEGGGGNRVTDDAGAFTLRGVVPGARFRLRAAAKGFAPATSDVLEVAAGQTRTGVELRLCAGGTIEVTHSDATARVHVHARALDADGKPDPAVPPVSMPMREGAVKLDGLRPGPWVVTARAMTDPSSRNERTVEVAAGATTRITF